MICDVAMMDLGVLIAGDSVAREGFGGRRRVADYLGATVSEGGPRLFELEEGGGHNFCN